VRLPVRDRSSDELAASASGLRDEPPERISSGGMS
jgi:hypothetical protein